MIVGIVTGVRRNSLERPAEPGIYIPQAQAPTNLVSLVIRTQPGISAASLRRTVRSEMAAVDKELAAQRVDMMAEVVAERLARPRFAAGLLSAFGLLALMLTVTGVYGVAAYTVRLRTREIGIRMALALNRATFCGSF